MTVKVKSDLHGQVDFGGLTRLRKMARGNWDGNVIKPKAKCRLCRFSVADKDFVRLDGIYPAHKTCAEDKGRTFTIGKEIEGVNDER
jgi:hypothetical protein